MTAASASEGAMVVDPLVAGAGFLSRAPLAFARRHGVGMRTLAEAGADLIARGRTTTEVERMIYHG